VPWELEKSAKRITPALIPFRDRGATYGRQAELNVPNPKGEPRINLCCWR